MSISFNQVPNNIRVPFIYVEFDSSRAAAGAGNVPFKTLIIGQKTASGTATAGERVAVTSPAKAADLYGNGSQLARMIDSFRTAAPLAEADAVALDDLGAGVAAAGNITITGTATETGILSVTLAGRLLQVGVNNGDTATATGDALESAINAAVYLPVTASNAAGVVTITAKNKGEAGNDIKIIINKNSGEKTPGGLTVVSTAMSAGAGNPDITAAFAAAGDDLYQVITAAYTDAANLTVIENELARKWGPLVQAGGVYISTVNKDLTSAQTLGNSKNSAFISISNLYGTPSATDEVSAELAGTVAQAAEIDPARPFQTLKLNKTLAPNANDRFTIQENNTLLNSGIATLIFNDAGEVRVQRLISTYKTNEAGGPDVSYLDINTPLTLEYIRQDFKNYILGKYPRHKLANDGANFGPGQPVITPKVGKAEAIKKFKDWETAGLVEGLEQFKNELICERNAQDPNRLDWQMSPDLINQFRVGGVKIQFLL